MDFLFPLNYESEFLISADLSQFATYKLRLFKSFDIWTKGGVELT